MWKHAVSRHACTVSVFVHLQSFCGHTTLRGTCLACQLIRCSAIGTWYSQESPEGCDRVPSEDWMLFILPRWLRKPCCKNCFICFRFSFELGRLSRSMKPASPTAKRDFVGLRPFRESQRTLLEFRCTLRISSSLRNWPTWHLQLSDGFSLHPTSSGRLRQPSSIWLCTISISLVLAFGVSCCQALRRPRQHTDTGTGMVQRVSARVTVSNPSVSFCSRRYLYLRCLRVRRQLISRGRSAEDVQHVPLPWAMQPAVARRSGHAFGPESQCQFELARQLMQRLSKSSWRLLRTELVQHVQRDCSKSGQKFKS